ncbi:MAG: class I SAM-dependent methyltransferase [Bacteroidales bacterium]|jgi:SAM-dependent methyltransferase|nr:class I SAM-dependent methyltransferase [Bacteroidales bacterium]MDD3331046.1 class I SAM-dependent methyltransferase [Bacteroidales bacterium]MDD3692068.1 class I SAM-dependent methyltransferase [Bacteroidales bacterium]MDD4045438.1 class I SAM-dependent methyltransferase [Bacteroidales bacterium]MDD4582220.1 class I SAM-dependent methyltransferase [Bacteroidales bacterium]
MHIRYVDRKLYFYEQTFTTNKYVIPYIQQFFPINENTKVLEIGCGEGGNLKPFLDKNCLCTGIDINEAQIENAKTFYEDHPNKQNIEFIASDIYKVDSKDRTYDLIMLRDVIEHIPHQEVFMQYVKHFLAPGGVLFFGFPPWQNPFGGHQQVCQSKLSKMPYIHLLPATSYRKLLIKHGEDPTSLLEVKETGISIERFECIVHKENYHILDKQFYFINPNYEIKFNLKPRKVSTFFGKLPYIRNFYTTAAYYILQLKT